MVFHVFPNPVCDAFEFELNVVGVFNSVDGSAIFNPPEVVVFREWFLIVKFHSRDSRLRFVVVEIVVCEVICPFRSGERMVFFGFAQLKEDGVTHGLGISAVLTYE